MPSKIDEDSVFPAAELPDDANFCSFANILRVDELARNARGSCLSGFTVTYGITSDVATPEPSSILLMLSGAALFAGLRIRRS